MCPYKDTYINEPPQTMERELFVKVLDDLTPNYTGQIGLYLQHEPLLDVRLPHLISLAKKKCPKCYVALATNGHLLTPAHTRRLIARPLDVMHIHISAGNPKTYEKVMSPLKWSRTIANARYFIKHFKGEVSINYVKTPANVDGIAKLERIFPTVPVLSTYWACNRGGSLDFPRAGKSRFHNCKELINLPILQDGTILLCCNCWKREVVLGNAYRDNVLKVWNSPHWKPTYDVCKGCW